MIEVVFVDSALKEVALFGVGVKPQIGEALAQIVPQGKTANFNQSNDTTALRPRRQTPDIVISDLRY